MARILALTFEFPPFRGGIGAVAHGLAAGAAGLGHDVHVLAPDYGLAGHEADAAEPFEVQRFRGDFCSVVSTDGIVRHTRRVLAAIRRCDPDVVHAVDPPSQMALAMLARLRLVRRHFLTIHGTELLRYRAEAFPRIWMGRGLRRATAICAVSEAVRDLLLESAGTGTNVFVSYPGIAPAWFDTPRTDRATRRATWGVMPDDVVLLTLARRVREKGHLEVIDALARLPVPARRRVAYVVLGRGPPDYARELVRAAGRGGVRLHLPGAPADGAAIAAMDAADLFIMLSRETRRRIEGLGLAFLEAGARSVPSVAADSGGVREAVLDGETGVLVPAGSDGSAASAVLERLVADAALRARLGAGANRHAAAFTLERHAREVYDRFLSA